MNYRHDPIFHDEQLDKRRSMRTRLLLSTALLSGVMMMAGCAISSSEKTGSAKI